MLIGRWGILIARLYFIDYVSCNFVFCLFFITSLRINFFMNVTDRFFGDKNYFFVQVDWNIAVIDIFWSNL